MTDIVRPADRITQIPPYLFAELDKKKRQLRERGITLIDLSIGDPDIPTPDPIVHSLHVASLKPSNHRYPSYSGSSEFRRSVADYYHRRYSLSLDPTTDIIALIGSKEGIAHFPLTILNPGDIALVPDPGYPVYRVATLLAGGIPYSVPLLKRNGFFPDFSAIPDDVLRKSKLLFLNYPNNPTSATATRQQLQSAISFCQNHGIALLYDMAYSEIYFGERPLSILELDGGREVAIEMGSLSKTFNMTGWRIGYAVGNPQFVSWLGQLKTNIDSGAFTAIQDAAITALNENKVYLETRRIVSERRQRIIKALEKSHFEAFHSDATFYVWVTNPAGMSSMEIANRLIEETGVVVTPGAGFGRFGEGYFRISVTAPDSEIDEAIQRIHKFKL